MSNRLEQEFPEVAWQAQPPIGPGGVSPELMRLCLERGRQLRNRAMRQGLQAGGAAVVRSVILLLRLSRALVARPSIAQGGQMACRDRARQVAPGGPCSICGA